MVTFFYVSDYIMNTGRTIIQYDEVDRFFKRLMVEIETNAKSAERRRLNSILSVRKNLGKLLCWNDNRSPVPISQCLPYYLGDWTTILVCERNTDNQQYIESIMKIIPRCCPNIKAIDFKNVWIKPVNKECFKSFLKDTPSLKSLRVFCSSNHCAINQLLLEDDFNQHDQDVKSGLEKIQFIKAYELSAANCARVLKLLPNLKCFGCLQDLAPIITSFSHDEEIVKKLSNINELYEQETSLATLNNLVKFFPKTKNIFLNKPQKNVVENLWKFPLLKEIYIYSREPDFVSEIIKLLKRKSLQIKNLELNIPPSTELRQEILYLLCPTLINLKINEASYLSFKNRSL